MHIAHVASATEEVLLSFILQMRKTLERLSMLTKLFAVGGNATIRTQVDLLSELGI